MLCFGFGCGFGHLAAEDAKVSQKSQKIHEFFWRLRRNFCLCSASGSPFQFGHGELCKMGDLTLYAPQGSGQERRADQHLVYLEQFVHGQGRTTPIVGEAVRKAPENASKEA